MLDDTDDRTLVQARHVNATFDNSKSEVQQEEDELVREFYGEDHPRAPPIVRPATLLTLLAVIAEYYELHHNSADVARQAHPARGGLARTFH